MTRTVIVLAVIGFFDMAVQAATSGSIRPIRLLLSAIFA